MAAGDNDRPQVTQSSNPDEPSSISPLDIRSVSPLATGQAATTALASLRASIQRAAADISDERDYVRDNPISPKPVDKPSTNDHAVLGLCEILALMFGLPPGEALFRGEPLSLRLVGFIVAGAFFAVLGPGWPAVRKKFPQQTLVLSVGRIASDARYWLAIILVGFLYAASPEMYRRAVAPVVDVATTTTPIAIPDPSGGQRIITARELIDSINKLQSQVNKTTGDLETTKRQLSDAQRMTPPSAFGPTLTEIGAINWNPDFQLIITGGGPTAQINSVLFQGTSTASVDMKEAYAVSGMTGHKQELMENVQYKGYYHVDKVDIPSQAPVWLELIFNPPLSARDFLDQWGKFKIAVTYNGTTFDKSYDEEYIRRVLRATNPGYFGPKPTPKDDK